MKFRAKLKYPELLLKLCGTITKIHRDCVLQITKEMWRFILNSDASDGVQLFAGLAVEMLFEDYLIESANKDEIVMDVSVESIERILKFISQYSSIDVRLIKRDGIPCLGFQCENFEVIGNEQGRKHGSFSVPVNIRSGRELDSDYLTEPFLEDDPDVHLVLPSLVTLRSIIERLKNISDKLTIEANMNGEMKFGAEASSGTVEVRFNNLCQAKIQGRENTQSDVKKTAKVVLDINKFHRFLFCYQIKPKNVICCVTHNKSVVVHVMVDQLYLTYYIPVIIAHI